MGGLTGLYHCRHINYCRASRLYRVLFSDQTGMLRRTTSGSGSLILLVVSQQTSHWLLRAFHTPWPCSIPAWNAQSSKISLPMLLVLADYWSRGIWIISQVPLMPEQSQVINWIAHGGVRWVEQETSLPCSNHPNCHALTEQFADSACSNYTICLPGRYSSFTQYNHRAVPLSCIVAVVQ